MTPSETAQLIYLTHGLFFQYQGWMTLASMYRAMDNEARAIEIYNMLLESDPANEQARDGLRDLGTDP